MIQRNGLYRQRTVFVNHLLLRRIYLSKLYFVVEVATEGIHLALSHLNQLTWCVDHKPGRSSKQTESAQHTNQPKAMVTMQM